jgi:hypothetical protein
MLDLMKTFPILNWLPKYERGNIRGDITAGLTVAVIIIPQAIAYGLLAGVSPEVALYASIVPMFVYAALGTCRELPSASLSCLGKIGPGFHLVGIRVGFGGLSAVTKLVLTGAMWVGRLEVVRVLALFHPDVWKNVRMSKA